MGYQLSKVIQYFFSILFPILACIIGGLANLEFSYHYYIQFNPYHHVNYELTQFRHNPLRLNFNSQKLVLYSQIVSNIVTSKGAFEL